MTILQTKSYAEMSHKAAAIIAAQMTLKPRSVLGLATGSTPIGAYQKLVEWYNNGDLDFSQVTTINLDEYCGLASDDPQGYRYFMNQHLFSLVNIPAANTNVPIGTADPAQECARYDSVIDNCGGIDLQLLGLGPNGHIGFNEPGTIFEKNTHCVALTQETIQANKRFFASEDLVPRSAITMGMKAIMQAKRVLLVVSGKAKADILDKALNGPITPALPASILQLHPNLTVVTSLNE